MKKTQVVLIQSVDDVGEIGEVVAVSRGYARNYLIPRGWAIPDSDYARQLIKSRHKVIAHARAQRRAQAEEHKALIEQEPCHMQMRTSATGKLFGSVTAHAIAEQLAKRNVHISNKSIKVPHHRINTIGEYDVPIHVYDDIVATLSLQIAGPE